MIDADAIRKLLTQVPKNPDETLPSGLLDEDLDGFTRRTGIAPPPDLRAWLKICNGPCVGPGGLFGIREGISHLNIESYLDLYPCWKDAKWIPIAGDGCGNYFVDTHESSESPAFIVASDLAHFLVFLLEQELGPSHWPFRERMVVKKDPAILGFSGVALLWEVA